MYAIEKMRSAQKGNYVGEGNKMNKTAKLGGARKRDSNIELLRILMMLSLIAHHFVVNSGITERYNFNNITYNMVFLQIFAMWGKIAINIFTIITGYFMIKNEMTGKRILKLFLEIMFYEVVFYLAFLLTGYQPFSFKEFIAMLLIVPHTAGRGYAASMMVMLIFVPFANILAKGLSKQQYQLLIVFLLVYFTGFATFLKNETFDFVFWMLAAYLTGGYMRLYPCKWDKLGIGAIGTVASIFLMIASIVAIDIIGTKYGVLSYDYFVSDCNKILAVTASVSIFVLFKNWRVRYCRVINTVASTTFGVLMIHAGSDTMRRFLWRDVFDNAGHYDSFGLIPYACGVVLLVYVVCVGIDLLRIRFIEKPLFDKLEEYRWIHKALW